jgi:hypothetical protein
VIYKTVNLVIRLGRVLDIQVTTDTGIVRAYVLSLLGIMLLGFLGSLQPFEVHCERL